MTWATKPKDAKLMMDKKCQIIELCIYLALGQNVRLIMDKGIHFTWTTVCKEPTLFTNKRMALAEHKPLSCQRVNKSKDALKIYNSDSYTSKNLISICGECGEWVKI